MCLQYKSFENTVGNGEVARSEQFSFSHSVLCPFDEHPATCIKFKNCHLQTPSCKCLKFVVCERVNWHQVTYNTHEIYVCLFVLDFKAILTPKVSYYGFNCVLNDHGCRCAMKRHISYPFLILWLSVMHLHVSWLSLIRTDNFLFLTHGLLS